MIMARSYASAFRNALSLAEAGPTIASLRASSLPRARLVSATAAMCAASSDASQALAASIDAASIDAASPAAMAAMAALRTPRGVEHGAGGEWW